MLIVGICGASGSGKSTLARRIRDALTCSCVILGQDGYYKSFPQLSFAQRERTNYDEPSIFDYDEMLSDVLALSRGEAITTKAYDYTQHLRADRPDLIRPPEVLILEGIHMFHDKRLCELMVLKVFLQVDADICLLRRIRRDIKQRGRTIDNIAAQYLETVKPMYEKYISKYIDDADFAVMRGGKNRMAIDAISAYLTTRLLAERFEEEHAPLSAAPKDDVLQPQAVQRNRSAGALGRGRLAYPAFRLGGSRGDPGRLCACARVHAGTWQPHTVGGRPPCAGARGAGYRPGHRVCAGVGGRAGRRVRAFGRGRPDLCAHRGRRLAVRRAI